MIRLIPLVVALGLIAGCSNDGGGSPTSPTPNPTPTPTATRVIALEGDLNFGNVLVGATAERVIRILNRGTAVLTITGLSGPSGLAASWTQGDIQPGQWQDTTVRFTPTELRSYSGTVTVNGNHTSGTNTMTMTATGARERWSRTGTGNQVFDMPSGVTRLRIIGNFGGFCQNFVIRVGGRLVVNEILGTCSSATTGARYDGTHVVSGTQVEVTNSNGVSWSLEELR